MRATNAVWIGRMQPYHVGHWIVLRESLQRIALPHIVCFVCASPKERAIDSREMFSPWERAHMLQLILDASGLADRVSWLFVPRFSAAEWAELDLYLPPGSVRCVGSGYADADERSTLWRELGLPYRVIKLGQPELVSSTAMRKAAADGGDWREFLHPAVYDFFSEIDGPLRIGFQD